LLLTWNAFRARVDVVELQGGHAPVVAADRASPASLGDQDLLDLAAAARDRRAAAP
jgi:hypothetical protein